MRLLQRPILLALLFGLAPPAGAEPALAGHHAVYRLTLAAARDQGVLSAEGRMEFDLTDACSGWTTAQRLQIDLTDRDGRDSRMTTDYATFESKDGRSLTFHSRQADGRRSTLELSGTARLDHEGGAGHADYTQPAQRRVELPAGTLLPNAHTMRILQYAHAEKRFLGTPLFDGTGEDGAQDSFVTIERWQPGHTAKWSALSGLPSGRVHIAFFDRADASETPDYETGMRYFDNGVADDLTLNFGDFVMQGRLVQLEMKPSSRC